MGFLGASLWALGATFGSMVVATLFVALRPSAEKDPVVWVGAQLVAYLLVLFALLRFYGPEQRVRDFVAARHTHPAFYPLALLLGASAALPANWLFARLLGRFPEPKLTFDLAGVYFASNDARRVALALALALVVPLSEEVLFRGGLFGPMLKRQRTTVVIVMTALLFAIVHQDPRAMVPILPLGLLLGYLRAASGSLWPPVLMHVGFNGVDFVDLALRDSPPPPGAQPSATLALIGLGVCLVAFGLSSLTAKYSRTAKRARDQG